MQYSAGSSENLSVEGHGSSPGHISGENPLESLRTSFPILHFSLSFHCKNGKQGVKLVRHQPQAMHTGKPKALAWVHLILGARVATAILGLGTPRGLVFLLWSTLGILDLKAAALTGRATWGIITVFVGNKGEGEQSVSKPGRGQFALNLSTVLQQYLI